MLCMMIILSGCNIFKQSTSKMRSIDLFKTYITGDFNNDRQIAEEIKSGKQLHPKAVHVNRIADHRILNAPKVDGFWILEESYYTKPGQSQVEVKPYLFLFEAAEDGKVKLTPFALPKDMDVNLVKNENASLKFDFNTISPSPSFKPAFYTRKDDKFYINAPNDLPNGMKFTLIETISSTQLIVMELLEKDGKKLTPYETPIVYDRVK
jgi:hypothetical protein